MTKLERQDRWLRTVVLAGLRVWCAFAAAQAALYMPGLILMTSPLTKLHPFLNRVVLIVSSFMIPVLLAVCSCAISKWIVPAPTDLRSRFPRIEQFARVAIRASLVVVAVIVASRLNSFLMRIWTVRAIGGTSEWELALEGWFRTSLELLLLPLLGFAVERRIVPWILAGWPRGVACPKCGYDIQGLTTGKCPECGADAQVPVASRP